MTLSLGDGMRPGCLSDARQGADTRLILLARLQNALMTKCQVMIEAPYYAVKPDSDEYADSEKLCNNAPFIFWKL